MINEEFSTGDSRIHRLDPRVKIAVSVAFAFVVALGSEPAMLAAAAIFAAALVLFARLAPARVGVRLLLVNGFMVFVWAFVPFAYPGETVFSVGGLDATREGLVYCLLVTVKCNTILAATIALLGTSSVFDLVHALSHFRVPDKLIQLFFFIFRYMHVVRLEYARLTNAMRVRCFEPGTNAHTYRTYAYLAGMLMVRSYDRSERIYNAMLCRGFKGKYYLLDHFVMRAEDAAFLTLFAIYIVMLAVIEWL
ncbi:MAG: cobalt ECF transporter T component CbiQ [bacterium]